MLQIFVYGTKYSGYLDLVPDASLDIEMLTELFDEELTLGEYSLPLEVPWTDNNKKILGFIEMINTLPATDNIYWRCHVYNNGIPEMLDAKLTYLEFGGSFNYEKGRYSFSISGNKGLFGTLIAKKTLQDLTIDKIIFPEDITSRVFATNVMKSEAGYSQYTSYMRFAPVAILNFFDTERPDYNDEFLVNDIVNKIVITGAGENDWEFGRPTSVDTSIPAAAGAEEYVDHRTIPFFSLKYILQKLFEQFGYTVEGEFIADANWNEVFLFNNFAIEKYTAEFTDVNNEIDVAKHFPKKLIGTFLRDLQITYNVKLSFKTGNRVSIDYRKSSLKSSRVIDVTKLANRIFNGTVTDYKEKGFTLAFNFDSADSYNSQRIQDIDVKKVVATIDKFADFPDLVIGRAFEYNDLVYVTAENQYYAYSNGVGVDAWEYYSEKFFPYNILPLTGEETTEEGGYKYETALTPMITHIQYDDDLDKLVNQDMVAADMPGSYFNKKFNIVENPFDTRIFYIKNLYKNGNVLPVSFSNNRDRSNFQRVPKSLAWYGDDGLYEYCWREWLQFLSNTRKVKTNLSLNEKEYADLRQADKIRIDGIVYLASAISAKIPLRGEVEVETLRL